MNCKDCLHYEVCYYHDFEGCLWFSDKSEWVHLPCKKGDVIERKGEQCEVDHWNVLATAFTEDNKLRLFGVEEAEKALADRRKEDKGK